MNIIEKFDIILYRIETAMRRVAFVYLLSRFARNRIRLIIILRIIIRASVFGATFTALLAFLFWSGKFFTIAGMLFDLAGLSRIFIDEEWEDIVPQFDDLERYPGGPPSYITREMFKNDNPEALGDLVENEGHMARHLYWRRGLALILVGFILQLIGTLMT